MDTELLRCSISEREGSTRREFDYFTLSFRGDIFKSYLFSSLKLQACRAQFPNFIYGEITCFRNTKDKRETHASFFLATILIYLSFEIK